MRKPYKAENAQSVFLEQIRNRIPKNIALADELAEILNISRDSAYRRIRGDTVLSLDEAKVLYDRYGVSLDAIFSPSSNMALFHHRALTVNYPLERWMKSVVKNLKMIDQFSDREMIIAAKDIPIFHYFRLPALSSFKMFFWMKTVIKDPLYDESLYHPDVISKDLLTTGSTMWSLYSKVPSTEIWGDEAINDTLKQIEYYSECGFFSEKQQPVLICEELLSLINMVKEEATSGKKGDGAHYKLYENEIITADNTVFGRMGGKLVVYINYNSLNLLTTLQQAFCAKTETYLNNLMKSSVLISASAEKERNKFFNKLANKIEGFRSRLL
ncbi:MAG TPA: hypothetical protein VIS49_05115 [Cyclobacteriaceae bacterium]